MVGYEQIYVGVSCISNRHRILSRFFHSFAKTAQKHIERYHSIQQVFRSSFAYGGRQKAFDSLELGISRIHQGMQRIKKTFQRATLLIHPINNIRVNQTEKFRFGNAN
ncbi:hypothetical protein CDAR_528161 [Caerostris darwini]|uniref:Transposase n=1 Tax=Caerostris darwini TaxID=1538125 RepID=A0AAV4R7N8_9ARAC|nr:hypothetical protein CDAR_528161 [Caerostris darwini]